jgi:hypothetical protein
MKSAGVIKGEIGNAYIDEKVFPGSIGVDMFSPVVMSTPGTV